MVERPENAAFQERNLLLRALPPEEYEHLKSYLETVSLEVNQVLSEANQPIRYVHFPQSAVTSLLALDGAGGAVEVGTVGNEGMAGISLFHGVDIMPHKCFIQIAGESRRISADAFRAELIRLPTLRVLLHRYTVSVFSDAAQAAACNRLHAIKQRCARWLLMTHDRVDGSEFLLKQEFLAYMLGTPRPAVSVACGHLQTAGLIRYSRAKIHVLDRAGLEAMACECYGITHRAYAAVFSDPVGGSANMTFSPTYYV